MLAIVTGSNRGIGFQIAKDLLQLGYDVLMTARDEKKGRAAFEKLKAEKEGAFFHPLDVSDAESRIRLVEYIEQTFGRVDVLINNGGILLDEGVSGLDVGLDIVRQTWETNTLGPLHLSQLIIPIMQKNDYGRVVNVSSTMGSLSEMGRGYLAYRLSKTGLNAITKVLAKETRGTNILINTMSPGWVRTDMGGAGANRSVEKGAETVIWLATLPDNGPTGKFFKDKRETDW